MATKKKAADYPVNSIKRNPDGSGYFAIRTGFDDGRDWKVVGLVDMTHYVPHKDVEGWADMV